MDGILKQLERMAKDNDALEAQYQRPPEKEQERQPKPPKVDFSEGAFGEEQCEDYCDDDEMQAADHSELKFLLEKDKLDDMSFKNLKQMTATWLDKDKLPLMHKDGKTHYKAKLHGAQKELALYLKNKTDKATLGDEYNKKVKDVNDAIQAAKDRYMAFAADPANKEIIASRKARDKERAAAAAARKKAAAVARKANKPALSQKEIDIANKVGRAAFIKSLRATCATMQKKIDAAKDDGRIKKA